MTTTHEVTNQSAPLADVNLFAGNLALQGALRFNQAGYDRARFEKLGGDAGSAEMQVHARLANTHTPALRTHDRFGRRIDQVEFHPSYHALMRLALQHRLHGAPWSEAR